ncbi:Alpha/beta hydrolase family protein [Pirellulimonas nuda]|uniref:Alpha/beta hydrolase family protein n=1 Tax=Pirellulimonas nuda TaxID=2528009 RepID=A0A518D8E1_9BACT|nr:alpha/beta hydrolase [Pirellulimonas nuda]QDU87749.1 Alpha/beta hydrolase family protein [Pirellulimonas nuda]
MRLAGYLNRTAAVAALMLAAATGSRAAECGVDVGFSRPPAVRGGWLRRRLVREADLQRYGLRLEPGWESADPSLPLVVLIHGFNSSAPRNAALLGDARCRGYPCGGFSYPNDQPLSPSAALLSAELKAFAAAFPQRRLALVTHSMGGLVARACLETPELDPGNVDRLIMVAPPTHGAQLARIAVATDVWEHWVSRNEGDCWTRMHDSFVDGLGEAGGDLCPESPFLKQLNARSRNTKVDYTLLLGNAASLRDDQMNWLIGTARAARLAVSDDQAAQIRAVESVLIDLDELVDGRGDGIVSVERGRLEGVPDTLVLPFGHLSVSADGDDAAACDVRRIICERLGS